MENCPPYYRPTLLTYALEISSKSLTSRASQNTFQNTFDSDATTRLYVGQTPLSQYRACICSTPVNDRPFFASWPRLYTAHHRLNRRRCYEFRSIQGLISDHFYLCQLLHHYLSYSHRVRIVRGCKGLHLVSMGRRNSRASLCNLFTFVCEIDTSKARQGQSLCVLT
jgi:hypothetical protein